MFDGHHQPVPADAMPRRFLLEHTCKLDKPKGKSTTSVLKGISDDLEAFYGNVVEHLAGYVAPAPKLPKEHAAGEAERSAVATVVASTLGAVPVPEPERESGPTPQETPVREAPAASGLDACLAAGAIEDSVR
jgi:hypothetical protein